MNARICLMIPLAILALALAASAQPAGRKAPPRGPANYLLGPDDQINIRVLDMDELKDVTVRVDNSGGITLPLIGRVTAGGCTLEQVESEVARRLDPYLVRPSVTSSVTEYRSQPVSILGAVNRPGVHQLQGRKTLFEVLSLAEGLRTDAGNIVKITRRLEWGPIPLRNARQDPSDYFSVAEVRVRSIMEASSPDENIEIRPYDVISVPKADMVYVVGSVLKPGGFVLSEKENISVLQALALAGGLERTAAGGKAKIIRSSGSNGAHYEIPLDLSGILNGKAPSPSMRAEDILFIPGSAGKAATYRSLEAIIQMATGIAIWRH